MFHIASNRPFVDGNKRTALAVALTFLALNGRSVDATEDEIATLTEEVAAGKVTKAEVAVFFQRFSGGR